MRQRHILMIVWSIAIAIGLLWDKSPFIKNTFHSLLNPTLGRILNYNIFWSMTLIVLFLGLIMTLIQKYATDQKALKNLKKEQREFQKQLKEYKDDPAKILELNKKQGEFFIETLKLTSRSITYTLIPFVILFRWFGDYFANVDYSFLGFLSWFWFYVIASVLFSSIFRKVFKVA